MNKFRSFDIPNPNIPFLDSIATITKCIQNLDNLTLLNNKHINHIFYDIFFLLYISEYISFINKYDFF